MEKNGRRSSKIGFCVPFRIPVRTYWHEENREPAFRLTQQTSRAFGTKKDTFVRYHARWWSVGGYYGAREGRGSDRTARIEF